MASQRRVRGGAAWVGACILAVSARAWADPDPPGTRYVAFRAGADVGMSRISGSTYFQVDATALLRLGPVRLDLAAPLRFATSDFRFRTEDYAAPRDAFRVLHCLRLDVGDYARPEDRHDAACDAYESDDGGLHDRMYLSARVSPLRDVSLGHDTLVSGYNNSLDPNLLQMGGQLEGILRDWARAQAFVDDVTNPRLVAGNVSLRPLQVAGQNWDETPDDLRITAGIVSDLYAPVHVRNAFGQPTRDGSGALQMSTARLTAVTGDAHYLYLWASCLEQGQAGCDVSRDIGLFAFADYNRFLEVQDADGAHGGLRFRFRMRQRYRRANGQDLEGNGAMFNTWEVDIGGEYRNMGNRYMPEYFDANYAVQSQSYALSDGARRSLGAGALTTTKLEYLLSQPLGRSQGWQAYFRVYFPLPVVAGEPPSRIPLTLWAEDASETMRTSAAAAIGPFRLDQVALGAMIVRRNFDGWGNFFSFDGTMIRAYATIQVASSQSRRQSDGFLNSLAVNLAYTRRFLREGDGEVHPTDDFVVTLGSSLGVL